MPREIDVEEVQRLMRERDALVLEVLPAREFEEEHLPGAINIPLKELTEEAVADLDRARPVIVYCWDDV
jgi:rhodanese-related sulfurtransferase